MAFRRPLYYNGSGQLQEMSDGMIGEIQTKMFWEYIANPSVFLDVWGSGANLGTMTDTRLQAGAASTSATDYPSEATTAEPSVVSTYYTRINQSIGASNIIDTNNIKYPAYFDQSNTVRAMSMQDIFDTFAYTAVNWIHSADSLYTVSTSSSVGGYSLVSWTPIFSDTRADTGAYTAGEIEETLDQSFTVNNYYLHKRNWVSTGYTLPVCINSSGNIYITDTGSFNAMLAETVRYVAAYEPGHRLRFAINWGTSTHGTGMTDTRLDGSGNYQQRFVNGDDYRSQEFPDGTARAISVYYLQSRLE